MGKRISIPKEIFFVLILLVLVPLGFQIWTLSGGDSQGDWVVVTDVVDGDTIHVGRGWKRTTVRLIGVDTPETVHPEKPVEFFGPEASEFARSALKGKWVHLQFEPSDRIDRYGRLLAYVFMKDGTFFNRELVRKGYARVLTGFPCRYMKEFLLSQQEAREARLGLWIEARESKLITPAAEETSTPGIRQPLGPAQGKIIGNVRSKIYHLPGQQSYNRISEENTVYFDTEAEAIRAGYRRAKM